MAEKNCGDKSAATDALAACPPWTPEERQLPCLQDVASPKMPMEHAKNIFNLLRGCQHQNILKPHGVWGWEGGWEERNEAKEKDIGTIIFPELDGTINSLPISELFLMGTNASGAKRLLGFTEQGHRIFGDIVSAVQHFNMLYESNGNKKCLQLLRLRLMQRIFYMKGPDNEYCVMIGDFYDINDKPPHNLPKTEGERCGAV